MPKKTKPATKKPAQKKTPVKPPRQAAERPHAVSDLMAADHDHPSEPTSFYPLFPDHSRGSIARMRVFRKHPKPNGGKGMEWRPIALTFPPESTTWDTIAECCGGGNFVVQAIDPHNKVIASPTKTIEGEQRTPTIRDAARLTPGLNHDVASETASGYLTVPGLDASTQLAFLVLQNQAHNYRDDMLKLSEKYALTINAMQSSMMAPDPALAVLQAHIQSQAATINQLQKELSALQSKHISLQLDNAKSGSEFAKNKLMEKGVEVIDNVAGGIMMQLKKQSDEAEAAREAAKAAAAAPKVDKATVQVITRTADAVTPTNGGST